MAKKTIYVSDKSGTAIPEGQGARVRITYSDARRGVREADVTATEAEELTTELNANQVARRGRKPGSNQQS